MQPLINSIIILAVILWLTACGEKSQETFSDAQRAPVAEVVMPAPAPDEVVMPASAPDEVAMPAPAPDEVAMPAPAPDEVAMPVAALPEDKPTVITTTPKTAKNKAEARMRTEQEAALAQEVDRLKAEQENAARSKQGSSIFSPNEKRVGSLAPAAQTSLDDSRKTLGQRIDDYFSSLKTAAYTFNPPSPIQVAEPVTVHFWLDPQVTSIVLAEELKKLVLHDAARVESGQTSWSPIMRATLRGPDFDVKAVDPEEQPVSATGRTTWSWDIMPLRAGEKLALHLRLASVLPAELGPPKTITTLDREITVEVTWWWLFDHYFEKYWKWLLGGLGTAMASITAWWWKNRRAIGKVAN